jgi:hypothetical protein
MLRHRLRNFSTSVDPKPNVDIKKDSKLKATPKAGFKLPKLKEGQEIVGFRPYGHTQLTGNTQNYNFAMFQQNNEKRKIRMIGFVVLLSMIPIAKFFMNAEGNFRKAEVKKIALRRR